MGAPAICATFTESRDGPDPPGARLYVGLDVGRRAHLVAAIADRAMADGTWERTSVRRIETNAAGFTALTAWLEGMGPPEQALVACEPTGGWYARTVVAWLENRGYPIVWLQNWALHERRQLAIGKQTKTDALDARLLARLLYERDRLGAVGGFLHPRSRSADALRLLTRNRLKLVILHTRYQLQLGVVEDVLFPELKAYFPRRPTGPIVRDLLRRFPTPAALAGASPADLTGACGGQGRGRRLHGRLLELQARATGSAGVTQETDALLSLQRWLLHQLDAVDDEIATAEQAITDALRAWPAPERAILASLPGMSDLRQAVLLSTIGDWRGFASDRQLRKLLGWYPELRQSGTSLSRHHLGTKGNRLARREVWLWAFALLAPRHPPTPFRDYYQRLRRRGMRGDVALGHMAGKLISVLFHCLKHGQPYDPVRHAQSLESGESQGRP